MDASVGRPAWALRRIPRARLRPADCLPFSSERAPERAGATGRARTAARAKAAARAEEARAGRRRMVRGPQRRRSRGEGSDAKMHLRCAALAMNVDRWPGEWRARPGGGLASVRTPPSNRAQAALRGWAVARPRASESESGLRVRVGPPSRAQFGTQTEVLFTLVAAAAHVCGPPARAGRSESRRVKVVLTLVLN